MANRPYLRLVPGVESIRSRLLSSLRLRAERIQGVRVARCPIKDGREQQDGRYVVTFKVADPAWFVREVLQYGAEAEVLEPEGLRDAVRQVVT